MKPEDVKVGMEFSGVDISGYWVVVEGIVGAEALCQGFTCFSGDKERINLRDLVNEKFFRLTKR